MELTILKKTEKEIQIRISGETPTLLNALKMLLLNNKHVGIATYDTKHPTISEPVLFVRTDGADPITTIEEAAADLIAECDEFINVFTKKAAA